MNPIVSVIMPLFNKAPYVKKAVESVLAQTFKDWELIVVDDGSTDDGAQIVMDLADERCHIYSQGNMGVGAARNSGVRLAKGELLAFLDADDWWDERFLEKMVAFADSYPEASLWASNYWYVKRGKTRVAVKQESGYFDYPESYLRNEAMPVWTGAVLLRKEAFDEAGGFPVGIKIGEDFLLWSRISLEHQFAFLNKPLAYYNNDVPSAARATRNLYLPEQHMLFHLEHLEGRPEWKALCDKLRANGLLEYWLSDKYNKAAQKELQKVDWKKQPKRVYRLYHIPRPLVRAQQAVMRAGSKCKQILIKLINK
ncbi:MAG: glycosyltransferase family 2 protein [Paludibacteraceae bacterium]|nr:glycosyltransferase family 2 protein [Paludibacteraceae bacterium]